MKVVQEYPPNIQQINQKFRLEGFNPVFTYGDTLYNPTGLPIDPDLMVHEEVHEKQQQAYGKDQWWAMYIENPTFRLTQEVEAYRAQYQFLKTVFNRRALRGALQVLSQNLSSELYGNIISKKEAQDLIENYA